MASRKLRGSEREISPPPHKPLWVSLVHLWITDFEDKGVEKDVLGRSKKL